MATELKFPTPDLPQTIESDGEAGVSASASWQPASEDVAASLTPFLPCSPEEADRDDYLSAARTLLRRFSEDSRLLAPDITPIVQEIGLDRINGRDSISYQDASKALDRLLAAIPHDLKPKLKQLIASIRLDWIEARRELPFEAVIEVLEYLRDYMAVSPPEAAMWLRSIAERELTRRFGRETTSEFLRRYVDPAPPGAAPYDDQGILASVDLSERKTVPWLVEGMIPSGTVGLWIAPFSSGKTFGAVSLGLSLTFGKDWLGQETHGGGHVRYVAAEGLMSFDRRLAGWLVRHELLPESFTRNELAAALDGRLSLSDGRLRLDDPRLEEALVTTIRQDGTRLLVLDTLGRLLGVGQSDEDNSVANSVMGALQRVAAITGCTILVVHHPGHTQTHRARGASAWAQAADWVLVSKGDLRGGKPVRLINSKQRDAELFEDQAYRLRPILMECEGEQWRAATFEPSDVARTRDIPLALRIRYDVQAHPGSTQREVRARVRGGSREIGDEIIRLLSAGKLKNEGVGNASELYDNPAEWDDDVIEAFTGGVDLSDLTGDADGL